MSVSILAITSGRIQSLAGVDTLSFVSVMRPFAIGDMLLESPRGRLPRAVRAGWPTVTAALGAVVVGLVGNVLLDPVKLEVLELSLPQPPDRLRSRQGTLRAGVGRDDFALSQSSQESDVHRNAGRWISISHRSLGRRTASGSFFDGSFGLPARCGSRRSPLGDRTNR